MESWIFHEHPTKLPLYQVGSSNNILNKIHHGNGLWFPFSIRKNVWGKSNIRGCSISSLYPLHLLDYSSPSSFVSLPLLFFSFLSSAIPHSPFSFSATLCPRHVSCKISRCKKHWARHWKQLPESSWGCENQYFSTSLWVMMWVLKAKWWCQDFTRLDIYFAS